MHSKEAKGRLEKAHSNNRLGTENEIIKGKGIGSLGRMGIDPHRRMRRRKAAF